MILRERFRLERDIAGSVTIDVSDGIKVGFSSPDADGVKFEEAMKEIKEGQIITLIIDSLSKDKEKDGYTH